MSASESRKLTELVGVRLTKDELTALEWLAARRGVKSATWLRQELLSAVIRMGPAFYVRTDAERVAAFLAHRVRPSVPPEGGER